MSPNLIEYNTTFEIVKENKKWFLSKRKDQKNHPIFDLDEGNWCSIKMNSNKKWFILFYKRNKDSKYYRSFVKNDETKSKFTFTNFFETSKESEWK